ncbi:T9SS C-terminal target domain-containing protein [Flavobacterium cupreum]|uniref:T9SS C-terminal target domain-containing protein n=2 Tax=Flavobacterium TaxID=237 RepID=A0A434A172_9FLAO|nr:T9SS type A sorting domain-containing protein [Flavobacterium cupreum]RUT68111.1 T9SS C-terminal target domain-containing protein [Flavobacterium cupreum]
MRKIYFLFFTLCFFNGLSAQVINIPDVNFKTALLSSGNKWGTLKDLNGNPTSIDSNGDSQIEVSEALNISYMELPNLFGNPQDEITDLTGIAFFASLKYLDIQSQSLNNLDILNNLTKLETLNCSNSKLTSLTLTSLVNLKAVFCFNSNLENLSVNGLLKLEQIHCNGNKLNNLNLQGVSNLIQLNIANNPLTEIDLSNLGKLKALTINNNFSSLDFSNLINLESLTIGDNVSDKLKLQSLNFSSLKKLKNLKIYNAQSLRKIDLSGLQNLSDILCEKNQIEVLDITGVIHLVNLKCNNNQIGILNTSGLDELVILDCSQNKINTLDLSNCKSLTTLDCSSNQIESINLSGCYNLKKAYGGYNLLKSLDLSNCCKNSVEYTFNDNKLETLFLKNGVSDALTIANNPTLKYVCLDEDKMSSDMTTLMYFSGYKDGSFPNLVYNSYCSFTPGGTFYTIEGNQKLDLDKNGCDKLDIVIPKLKFNITDGAKKGSLISDENGSYSIPVQAGTHTITPILENQNYFNVSPSTLTVTFPTQISPFFQNFCITANGVHSDLEILLIPLEVARPGFEAAYKIVYKNKGNQIQSGVVNLNFDDNVLDLIVANPLASTQTVNNLSWNFSNLKPFESREIAIILKLNKPTDKPAVNNGDILKLSTTITSETGEETPLDNTFILSQTVVGSFDPNDKTCLEGSVITPELIGEYVHYIIRFENTGTYPAQNIVVKDMIDLNKFDISTLVPTSSSHSFVTKISEGNKIEFIFENINLPFDNATNDGYVAFKVKTKPTLVSGDIFTNEANIYFDYNLPVLTNKAVSTFKTLGTQDFEFSSYLSLYPVPVTDILNIHTTQTIEIKALEIYDILGQIVIAVPNAQSVSGVDVSKLRAGNYFIKIKSDKGNSSMKFIKH